MNYDNPVMNRQELIERAYQQAGGRQLLSDRLAVSKQTLSDWKRKGQVPAKHAVALERLSGIPRQELCPDFDWGES